MLLMLSSSFPSLWCTHAQDDKLRLLHLVASCVDSGESEYTYPTTHCSYGLSHHHGEEYETPILNSRKFKKRLRAIVLVTSAVPEYCRGINATPRQLGV